MLAMNEKQFQEAVIEYARLTGWLVYHTYDSRRSQPGFPDLVMLKGRRSLYVELKSEKGKVTDNQKAWLAALREAGHMTIVWRPSDWPEIERLLR